MLRLPIDPPKYNILRRLTLSLVAPQCLSKQPTFDPHLFKLAPEFDIAQACSPEKTRDVLEGLLVLIYIARGPMRLWQGEERVSAHPYALDFEQLRVAALAAHYPCVHTVAS